MDDQEKQLRGAIELAKKEFDKFNENKKTYNFSELGARQTLLDNIERKEKELVNYLFVRCYLIGMVS